MFMLKKNEHFFSNAMLLKNIFVKHDFYPSIILSLYANLCEKYMQIIIVITLKLTWFQLFEKKVTCFSLSKTKLLLIVRQNQVTSLS
jgi:hypothetical protein